MCRRVGRQAVPVPGTSFGAQRHKIRDGVRHANLRLYLDRDAYGAASWWLIPGRVLDGNHQLEDLEAGDLTMIAVDNVIDLARDVSWCRRAPEPGRSSWQQPGNSADR